VLANYQKFARIEDLSAVILTHLHSDHMSDMMVLRYALQIKKSRGADIELLKVYAPSEPAEEYNRLNIRKYLSSFLTVSSKESRTSRENTDAIEL